MTEERHTVRVDERGSLVLDSSGGTFAGAGFYRVQARDANRVRVLEDGVALTEAAEAAGVSARTARKWVGRYRAEGQVGLLEVIRGASGGSRALPPASEQRLSAEELHAQADEIEQISDFRLATECAAAHLAARHRSDEEAARIARLLAGQDELLDRIAASGDEAERSRLTARFIELDNRFHLAIAAASHNHFLAEAVEKVRIVMHSPVGMIFASTSDDANYQHREIAEAIAAGDGTAAAEAMAGHIESTRETTLQLMRRPAERG